MGRVDYLDGRPVKVAAMVRLSSLVVYDPVTVLRPYLAIGQ
jgi:hypothetical protein